MDMDMDISEEAFSSTPTVLTPAIFEWVGEFEAMEKFHQ